MLTFRANPQQLAAALGSDEARRILGGRAVDRVGGKAGEQIGETSPVATVKMPVKTSVKTSVKILQLLEKNPELTLAAIAEKIGKSRRAIELASAKLVKEGRLKYVGPQKGGHWEILK